MKGSSNFCSALKIVLHKTDILSAQENLKVEHTLTNIERVISGKMNTFNLIYHSCLERRLNPYDGPKRYICKSFV